MKLDAESVRLFWQVRGRTITLVGAFLLPLYCSSPLFVLPLIERVPHQSTLGVICQSLQRMPLLMTQIGFLVWISWRTNWNPSRARYWQMLAATFLALVALPVVCKALESFTLFLHTDGWKSALAITWRLSGPPQAYVMALAQAARALVIVLVLRAAVRTWSVALIESGQESPKSRPLQFSIAHVLIATLLIALSIVPVPMVLRAYFWADQVDFVYRLGFSLAIDGLRSAFMAVTICAVAWQGLRSLDVMVPRLAIITVLFTGLMHLEFLIRSVVPTISGAPQRFSVLENLPFAIALVMAAALVFAGFGQFGLFFTTRRSFLSTGPKPMTPTPNETNQEGTISPRS